MALIINIALGLIPTLVLAGSIAAGIDDDHAHRRMFVFIYGLWALTLAMWNWMRSAHVAWIACWAIAGTIALAWWAMKRKGGATQ
jgi:hypothetical protein